MSDNTPIKEMCSIINTDKYIFDICSIASDFNNQRWGYFATPNHQIHIHVQAHACGDELKGKVWMTVRANWDDSCALSKHIYSSYVNELIATFNEYKSLAESIPEITDWQWYIDHGFKYYQV